LQNFCAVKSQSIITQQTLLEVTGSQTVTPIKNEKPDPGMMRVRIKSAKE
jgi:hypothetical protein